jgi:hypothetical protein
MAHKKHTSNQHELSGPQMQQLMQDMGINAQKVVRSRASGHYVADFFVPGMSVPVDSSRQWARTMQQRINGLKVIETNDTVAGWRSDNPIIWATVTFAFDQRERPPASRPSVSHPGWMKP